MLDWSGEDLIIFRRPHCIAGEPQNSPFFYLGVFPAHEVNNHIFSGGTRVMWTEFRCDTMSERKNRMDKMVQCAQNEVSQPFVEVTLSRYVASSH